MKLVIHAHALRNVPLPQAITGLFDEQGGTIGRSEGNTLVLPDAERHVSRRQAEVRFSNGIFSIRNVSSAIPIAIGGRPLWPGESSPLTDGDRLRIGGYAMKVRASGAKSIPEPRPSASERLLEQLRELLPQPTGPQEPDIDLTIPPAPEAGRPSMPSITLPNASQVLLSRRLPGIPLQSADLPPGKPIAAPAEASDSTIGGVTRADRLAVPSAPAPMAAGAEPPEPGMLWKAFCEGAGIDPAQPRALDAATMRIIGRLLHHAVEGALRLMMARAAARQEMRAQVTNVPTRRNSPLKVAADPASALAQLLEPPARGFLAGPEALRDAMDELLGHQIATMAGTRAALQDLLARFEPTQVEAHLSQQGQIDAVLPMNRRARLWELYAEHYDELKQSAQDDFHERFGKAFVQAYEQQIGRLESSRRKRA